MTNNIILMGDPHLGRSFIHGVPLARRGEREAMVWDQFEKELSLFSMVGIDYHICLGDLFDKAVVPYDVIDRAADLYTKAAKSHPKTDFIIVKGNHDWQRDLDRISAFDLFASIVASVENIIIVDRSYCVSDKFAVFAWHPTITAEQMVEQVDRSFETAFGHWDIEAFGDHNPNLIPLEALASKGVREVYTGHIHKPQIYTDKTTDIVVNVYGSMQPYAHGEEANSDLYLTLTKHELENTDLDLTNRCVRVLLSKGETLADEVNCLQLTIKRLETDEDVPEAVTLGDFNMDALFLQAFKEAGVSEEITQRVIDKYNLTRLSDGI